MDHHSETRLTGFYSFLCLDAIWYQSNPFLIWIYISKDTQCIANPFFNLMTFIADAFDELNSLLQHSNTSNRQSKSFKNLKSINSFDSITVRYEKYKYNSDQSYLSLTYKIESEWFSSSIFNWHSLKNHYAYLFKP